MGSNAGNGPRKEPQVQTITPTDSMNLMLKSDQTAFGLLQAHELTGVTEVTLTETSRWRCHI